MKVVVYEVVGCYEVEVDGSGALAMRDAVARVERGEVTPSPLECRHIAFPADSKMAVTDPREVLQLLLRADPDKCTAAAKSAGVFSLDDPNILTDRAGWLSAVVRRSVSHGRVAALLSALTGA